MWRSRRLFFSNLGAKATDPDFWYLCFENLSKRTYILISNCRVEHFLCSSRMKHTLSYQTDTYNTFETIEFPFISICNKILFSLCSTAEPAWFTQPFIASRWFALQRFNKKMTLQSPLYFFYVLLKSIFKLLRAASKWLEQFSFFGVTLCVFCTL